LGPTRGWYSDLELLQRGGLEVEGRIVLMDQGAPRVTPESPMALCKRGQHLRQPFPIFWIRRRNVRLVGPDLVHINARKQVSVEAVYGRPGVKDDPAYQFFIRGEPMRLAGPWTSVVSRWMRVDQPQAYGHWLLDALPRLAMLKEFPAETRILAPGHKARYQVESLELLGLSHRCRWTRETHLELEDYYFASPPSMIVCYSPYTVKVVRDMFLPLRDTRKTTPKRFFVRRSGTVRNMTNEAEVLEFFEKAGWTIVDLVNIPFAEQIAWFAGAEAIAGIHGSGMNNTLWSPRGCKIIELFCDQYIAGDAEWTAQCTGAEYHSLIFPSDLQINAIVDLDRVRATLKSAGLF
jgi:capsular polysaccharide biosynthesis protein